MITRPFCWIYCAAKAWIAFRQTAIAFNTKTGGNHDTKHTGQLEIFRQVIEQLNRADGKCELPLRNNFHRKSVLIEARIYQMPAADFQNIFSGLQFYKGSRGSDAWWSVSPEQIQSTRWQLGIIRSAIDTASPYPDWERYACLILCWQRHERRGIRLQTDAGNGFVDLTLQSTVVSGLPANTFTNHLHPRGVGGKPRRHRGSNVKIIMVRLEAICSWSSACKLSRILQRRKLAAADK